MIMARIQEDTAEDILENNSKVGVLKTSFFPFPFFFFFLKKF